MGEYGVSSDASGLLYMRARYYDPSTGQFASTDPLRLFGGDSNDRRYSGSNPNSLVDPTGLKDLIVPWGEVGTNDYCIIYNGDNYIPLALRA